MVAIWRTAPRWRCWTSPQCSQSSPRILGSLHTVHTLAQRSAGTFFLRRWVCVAYWLVGQTPPQRVALFPHQHGFISRPPLMSSCYLWKIDEFFDLGSETTHRACSHSNKMVRIVSYFKYFFSNSLGSLGAHFCRVPAPTLVHWVDYLSPHTMFAKTFLHFENYLWKNEKFQGVGDK